MIFSDETVMAYADGELDASMRAALELAMAGDPLLAQRVARQRALRARLRAAFDPVLDEPPAPRLLQNLREAAPQPRSATVVPLARRVVGRRSWPQWAAIAASLIGGALLGPLLIRTPGAPEVLVRNGQLQAGGALARALTDQLASSQAGAPVQIGVSFRAHNGDFCRSFVLHQPGALAGVACRGERSWRLEVLAPSPAGPGALSGYQPAASELPASVVRTLEELRAGEPLDAPSEAAARARGWHR